MKLLFIGNSHTYYHDMPQIVKTICAANGISVSVTMLAHGGKGFLFHADEPEVRFNILFGGYDYVILQHTAHPMGELSEMREGASRLISWIRQAGATPVFYMTWQSKRLGAEQQKPMTDAYLYLAQRHGCAVAPVGEVWWDFVAHHEEASLFSDDGEHASETGARLAAYTIASTLFAPRIHAVLPEDQPILESITRVKKERR